MIDLTTALSAIGGVGAIVAAATYVLSKTFDRVLDHKLKLMEESHKAQIAEYSKQTSALLERQFTPLKVTVSIAYRAKNAARDLMRDLKLLEAPTTHVSAREFHDRNAVLQPLQNYHNALEALLYEERAVIPKHFFILLHDLKSEMVVFQATVNEYVRLPRQSPFTHASDSQGSHPEPKIGELETELLRRYERIDKFYLTITDLIQSYIGSEKVDDAPKLYLLEDVGLNSHNIKNDA